MADYLHKTVLLPETVAALAVRPGAVIVDCTTGGAGHTLALLAACAPDGRVLALDRDTVALRHAAERTRALGGADETRLSFVHARFSELRSVAEQFGVWGQVDAICADLGVSSHHLDEGTRGFSFASEGPLDMRMDQTADTPSAADLVAECSEIELTRIFRENGEEPRARQIAQMIVRERARSKITTTLQLAELVRAASHYRTKSRKHPATRVFQALRIAVNAELSELEILLRDGFACLRPGGRLAIISFHSLEDRMVKRAFRDLTGELVQLDRSIPVTQWEHATIKNASGRIVGDFPTRPSAAEEQDNPRARSAMLRVIEKLR